MSRRRLRAKARGYADYARARAWRERHVFCPALLFATIAEPRAAAFLDLLGDELEEHAALVVCACGLAREPDRAVVEQVWQTAANGGPLDLVVALREARRPAAQGGGDSRGSPARARRFDEPAAASTRARCEEIAYPGADAGMAWSRSGYPARCGKRYIGAAAHGNGGRYPYYVCFTRQRYGKGRCDADRLPADRLDEAILNRLAQAHVREVIETGDPPARKALLHRRLSTRSAWSAAKRSIRPSICPQFDHRAVSGRYWTRTSDPLRVRRSGGQVGTSPEGA